jgi:hypothetical protein
VGNYAAFFEHPAYPDVVVKVYAPGRLGLAQEVAVYERLGTSIRPFLNLMPAGRIILSSSGWMV